MLQLRTGAAALSLLIFVAANAETPDQISAATFAQIPDMMSPKLSPDGGAIAFLRPVKGRQYLFVQEVGDDSTLAGVSAGDGTYFRWLNWASEERLVFSYSFSAKRVFTETSETRLMSVTRTGKDLTGIIKPGEVDRFGSNLATDKLPPPQLQDQVISWLPNDPKHILVAVDSDFDGRYEVRRVNVANGKYKDVIGNTPGIQNWIADQQDVVRFGYGVQDRQVRTVFRSEQDKSFKTGGQFDWLADSWYPTGFAADPDIVYVSGYGDSGQYEVRTVSATTGEFIETVFGSSGAEADEVLTDRFNRPAAISYTADFPRVKYLDAEVDTLKRSMDKALPDGVNKIVSMSLDRKRLLVESASDTDPGVVFLWDRGAKTLDPIGERMPGLDPELMSPTKAVSYTAEDGTTIPAYLTLPTGKSDKNLPAVVLPHGGPETRANASFDFLAQFLASRGYAVLQPNFRGSTGYGLEFRQAGRREWGGLMQDDVTDGAKWLVKEGIADPERMCIVGWSYGGYSAAMGAIKTPKLFKCAASINGVLNLVRLASDDKDYIGGQYWTRKIGLDGENRRAVSPYHRADEVEIPVLIVQSRDDPRVHLDQAKGMADQLKRAGKSVELVLVDSGGHSIEDPESRQKMLESLESFLGDHI